MDFYDLQNLWLSGSSSIIFGCKVLSTESTPTKTGKYFVLCSEYWQKVVWNKWKFRGIQSQSTLVISSSSILEVQVQSTSAKTFWSALPKVQVQITWNDPKKSPIADFTVKQYSTDIVWDHTM